ncbi:MAG: HAMP domain-containing histidine kinase [Clostridiaceae bacterium]|nr:HAMP domain-containing histidine kinase [Clostridiaceae bacterium]
MKEIKMSIRNRLRLSHMSMVLIPIILSIISTLIISKFFINDLETAYNFKYNKKATVEQLMDGGAPILSSIRETSILNPSLLENTNYLDNIAIELNKIHSGMIVRKANTIIYVSKLINPEGISPILPNFVDLNPDKRFHPVVGNQILKQIDFYFKDGRQGSVFLITDVSFIKKTIIEFLIIVIISIITIMIITTAFLTFLTTRSIVSPLEALKEGAIQIKNGNLDFNFKSSSKDEIGEVYSAFEEMRLKLKESLKLQQQYENNRKELISNISHDLKTPITAIKGYVEGIIDGVADSPEKMDKYIKTISLKSRDMERLIDELFLFSKLDLNKLSFNLEEINIKKYIEDCCEELQLDLEENQIKFEYSIKNSNSAQLILGDREKLKRVITNIIANSVKYMDKSQGKIQIELSNSDKFTVIKIHDNGKGISKEALPFVFDRFYRADASRNTLTGGSGLGLAISKLIIEELGGEIWAESLEGLGTSIFVTLKNYNSKESAL